MKACRVWIVIPVLLGMLLGCAAATYEPPPDALRFLWRRYPQEEYMPVSIVCSHQGNRELPTPFCLHVYGSSGQVTDSTYSLVFTISFDGRRLSKSKLMLEPDSIWLRFGDVKPVAIDSAHGQPTTDRGWQATAFEVAFVRSELEDLYRDRSQLEGKIQFSGYVMYGGQPVNVDTIRFVDDVWGSSRAGAADATSVPEPPDSK